MISSTWLWGMNFKSILLICLAAGTLICHPVESKTLERADAALQRLFPRSKVERKSAILSKDDQARIAEQLDTSFKQALVTYFRVTTRDKEVVYAYLDAHRVRTLPETLMISVDAKGVIHSVDVLVFREPEEYIPKRAWYEQLNGKTHSSDLRLNREIHGVSGATMTARATVNASRKVLNIHRVLMERDEFAKNKK